MASEINLIVGCQKVGEYVGDTDDSSNAKCYQAEVERPQIVADVIDVWGDDSGMR